MFDPLLLRTLVSVAETLSFTRSAQLLGLSQPTVSQHIRKLEKAAGRHLVTRDTRAVQLTDNGDALLGFARIILAAQNQAESYFSRLRRAEIGTHHHIAGPYLNAYANEMAWREDHRRVANGSQAALVGRAVMASRQSRNWTGYWQRAA